MSVLGEHDRRAIATSLAATGFLRRSPWPHGGAARNREWLHVSLHHQDLVLIVNASIVDDLRPAAKPHTERVRVLVVARAGGTWDGGVDEIHAPELRGGQLMARLGEVALALEDGRLALRGRLRERPIAFDLVLDPLAFPSLATGTPIGDEPPINWLVVPHLAATGRVEIEDRVFELAGVPAYHDHNWGRFSHRDLVWRWGHATGGGHSVVLAQLLDSLHASEYMQALLVWDGARQQRVFRGHTLVVEPEGFLRPARPFVVPRCASLLADGVATEVPRRLHLHASCSGDELTGVFEARDLARIVVPDDESLETTIIHEVAGRLHVTGRIRDRAIAIDAPAIFEFLRRVP
jgi:hypothetical protein